MAERFGKYELHRKIGHGGMAEVFAASFPTKSGIKICALKVIRPLGKHSTSRSDLFIREGKVAAELSHGNLVHVFDVGEHDGALYMAMQLIDGVSLARFLEVVRAHTDGRPKLAETVYIIREVLRALHYVHSHAVDHVKSLIVHRDVSPQNIMVTSSGEIKLADFGVARVVDDQTTNRIYGKLSYMPREQYMGEPVQQSDLFAAGAVFYEMLAGRKLRADCRSQQELHEAIMSGHLPQFPEGLPSQVEEALSGLLVADPAARTQSAKHALRQLGGVTKRDDIDLDIEDLYLDCVDSRHSWYTELTRQAEAAATTKPLGELSATRAPKRERPGTRKRRKEQADEDERAGAPEPGRSWELAQRHDAALDEVTTTRWRHPDGDGAEARA